MPRVARKKGATRAAKRAKPHSHQHAARESDGESTLPRALWSGTLSFGLVTIPVELYSATRSTRRSLRMLAPDGTPLSRRYFSAEGKPLESDDLERGYALDDGHFVVVEDDELERLLPDQSRDIDLTRFVPQGSIPPLLFDRAYILAPAQGASSAYRLLASTMERLDKAGIATFVMRDRQYLVAITARDGILRAETLRFEDELRPPSSVGLPSGLEPSEATLRHVRSAIKGLSKTRVAQRTLDDGYWQRVEKLVQHKKAHQQDIVSAGPAGESGEQVAEVIDLMALLRQSLAHGKTPAQEVSERPGIKKVKAAAGAGRRTRKSQAG